MLVLSKYFLTSADLEEPELAGNSPMMMDLEPCPFWNPATLSVGSAYL